MTTLTEQVLKDFIQRLERVDVNRVILNPTRQREIDPEHVDRLKLSYEVVGLIEPIVVNEDLLLIDGAHRLTAARELGQDVIAAVIIPNDLDPDDYQIIETVTNTVRKAISPMAMKRLADSYYRPNQQALANKRKTAGTTNRVNKSDVGEGFTHAKTGKANDFVASVLGVSSPTLTKIDTVVEWSQDETLPIETRELIQRSVIDEKFENDGQVEVGYKMAQRIVDAARTAAEPASILHTDEDGEPASETSQMISEAMATFYRYMQEITLAEQHLVGTSDDEWVSKHNRLVELSRFHPTAMNALTGMWSSLDRMMKFLDEVTDELKGMGDIRE